MAQLISPKALRVGGGTPVWQPPQPAALQSFSHGVREGGKSVCDAEGWVGESAGLGSPRLGTVDSSAILTVRTSPPPVVGSTSLVQARPKPRLAARCRCAPRPGVNGAEDGEAKRRRRYFYPRRGSI